MKPNATQAVRKRTAAGRKITAEHLSGDCVHLWLDAPSRKRLSKITGQVKQSINAEVSASVLIRCSLKAMERYLDHLFATEPSRDSGQVSFGLLELHRDLLEAKRGTL